MTSPTATQDDVQAGVDHGLDGGAPPRPPGPAGGDVRGVRRHQLQTAGPARCRWMLHNESTEDA